MICPATHLAVGLPMWVSRSGDGIWQPPIKKTAQNDDRPAWQVAASTASSAANHSLSLSYFILCVCVCCCCCCCIIWRMQIEWVEGKKKEKPLRPAETKVGLGTSLFGMERQHRILFRDEWVSYQVYLFFFTGVGEGFFFFSRLVVVFRGHTSAICDDFLFIAFICWTWWRG